LGCGSATQGKRWGRVIRRWEKTAGYRGLRLKKQCCKRSQQTRGEGGEGIRNPKGGRRKEMTRKSVAKEEAKERRSRAKRPTGPSRNEVIMVRRKPEKNL